MDFALVLMLGLVAGTVGGIVGFGTSIMLMPALVLVFGPREAVPIMAIAAIMANASRVVAWWRDVDWRATAAYSITGIPAAVLGARTLLTLPPGIVEAVLGVFFISMIPVRRWMARQCWTVPPMSRIRTFPRCRAASAIISRNHAKRPRLNLFPSIAIMSCT